MPETLFERRRRRTRYSIRKNAKGRIRLSVARSGKHIYAQIIDDNKGITLASASTLDTEVKAKLTGTSSSVKAAEVVGEFVAKRAIKVKIKKVVFDRGGYLYHGRVKALADAARSAGLSF